MLEARDVGKSGFIAPDNLAEVLRSSEINLQVCCVVKFSLSIPVSVWSSGCAY